MALRILGLGSRLAAGAEGTLTSISTSSHATCGWAGELPYFAVTPRSLSAAWAAARRAMGMRKGEQET